MKQMKVLFEDHNTLYPWIFGHIKWRVLNNYFFSFKMDNTLEKNSSNINRSRISKRKRKISLSWAHCCAVACTCALEDLSFFFSLRKKGMIWNSLKITFTEIFLIGGMKCFFFIFIINHHLELLKDCQNTLMTAALSRAWALIQSHCDLTHCIFTIQ